VRDERTNPIPWLVTKWEQVALNVLRWHLRKGVKLHNGEDFTAEAIKVTYETTTAPGSRAPWRARIGVIKEYRLRDAHTIDLVTERPTRQVLMVNNVPPDQLGRLRGNSELKILTWPTNRIIFVALRTDRKPSTTSACARR
jgi:ABC-type transport system substrate-binding protein